MQRIHYLWMPFKERVRWLLAVGIFEHRELKKSRHRIGLNGRLDIFRHLEPDVARVDEERLQEDLDEPVTPQQQCLVDIGRREVYNWTEPMRWDFWKERDESAWTFVFKSSFLMQISIIFNTKFIDFNANRYRKGSPAASPGCRCTAPA